MPVSAAAAQHAAQAQRHRAGSSRGRGSRAQHACLPPPPPTTTTTTHTHTTTTTTTTPMRSPKATSWPVSFLYTPEKVSVLYSEAEREGSRTGKRMRALQAAAEADEAHTQSCPLPRLAAGRRGAEGRGRGWRHHPSGQRRGSTRQAAGQTVDQPAGQTSDPPAELRSLGSSSTLSTLEPSSLQVGQSNPSNQCINQSISESIDESTYRTQQSGQQLGVGHLEAVQPAGRRGSSAQAARDARRHDGT